MLNSTEHETSTASKNLNAENKEMSCFKALRYYIILLIIVKMLTNCWHFSINEQDKVILIWIEHDFF